MPNSESWDIFMEWNAQENEPYPLAMTAPNQIYILDAKRNEN